jgi:putative two-component system response regulator
MFAERHAPHSGSRAILVVDDLETNRRLLERLLRAQGYRVILAEDGQGGLDAVHQESPDLVLSDIRMPRLDGFGLCRAIKTSPATRLIPVVLMTGATEVDDRMSAILAGADDFLTKPIDQLELEARVRSLTQLKRFTDELDSAEAVLRSLALMIEARDKYTEGHCQRLARYAVQLGAHLGLSDEDLAALNRGGYFHDIGKIGIPDAILLKPGPLTDDERALMQAHSAIGDRLCGDLRSLQRVRAIIRHHHERLDGSGYPDGLRGDEIPLLAQIIGIVDVYDALTSVRPYQEANSREHAFAELRREVALGWRRADLVEAFIETQQPAAAADPTRLPHREPDLAADRRAAGRRLDHQHVRAGTETVERHRNEHVGGVQTRRRGLRQPA